jgi:two-component system sensor histidine kinase PhoQ
MSSLQSKFAKITIVVLILFSLALAAFLDRMFHRAQATSEENRLKGMVYSLLGAVDVDSQGKPNVENIPDAISTSTGLSLAILDSEKNILWSNGDSVHTRSYLIPSVGEWKFKHLRRQNHASQIAFGLEWEGSNNQTWKYTVVIKDDGAVYRAEMQKFRRNLWTWLSIGCLTLLTLQLLLLKWGFRPLQQIADEVAGIEQGKQHKFNHVYPSELQPLTAGINSLLRHERGQQMRYQQSLDNLAHALKTPLTAMKNLSQQKEADTKTMLELSEQVDRAKDIVDYQLRKAAAVGKSPFAKPVHLHEVVEKVSRSILKVYAHKNIQIKTDIEKDAVVTMDEGDLFEVVGNIMENAAKYGKSVVHVQSKSSQLIIEDDGPGFSEDKIQSIVQRGVRQDQRMEGSGIGLSVAYEIISVFGGTLELGKSANLGGALVRIRL